MGSRRVTPTLVDPINGPNANVLKMTEADLMENTRQLATLTGWLHYHTRSSRGSDPGFPDWIAIRHPRILVIEFKSDTGRLGAEQEEWLAAWQAIAGAIIEQMDPTAGTRHPVEITAEVWRPADWLSRRIHRMLERR